ncbi:MAG TPA: hypothetical protein VFA88_03080 [Gaiellaceae bacterium]|nr:hypothetical protein [Gaiellaceae bacterium]
MSVRFHLLISDQQYACLAGEANRTGLPMAELARWAIDRVYRPSIRPRAAGVELSVGLWRRPDAAVTGRRPGIRLVD